MRSTLPQWPDIVHEATCSCLAGCIEKGFSQPPCPEAPTSWLLPRPLIRALWDVSLPGAIPPGWPQAHPTASPSCGDPDSPVLTQVE